MATFELSSKKYKNGRRPFKAILYELQPPESVVGNVGTKYNKNGLTFLEEHCSDKLDSIKDMSVTVEFLDEERTMISGHGQTGVQDGMPTFDNATTVGHFTEGFIEDVEINGEVKRCVLGKGYLDEMRYKGFVDMLETELNNGNSIDGSIEIFKSEGNKGIVYKYGWLKEGRIPTEFIHSGWAMVVNPADVNSTLLELNSQTQNKEEKFNMTEKEIMECVQKVIVETNSKNDELSAQITELNSQLAEKENAIVELNETIEQIKKELEETKATNETCEEQKVALENEVNSLKAERRLCELEEAISDYTEEEKKFAESEINSFKENPLEGNLETIKSKICVGIVEKQKEDARIAEQNSANETIEIEDIFSEINSEDIDEANDDINIF